MRRGVIWLLLLVLIGVAWYIDLLDSLEGWIYTLASHPDVVKSFNDPVSGRVDALILLVSLFLLTPFGLGLVLLGFIFVLMIFLLVAEPLFRAMRLPLWSCVLVVLGGSGLAAYLMRAEWFPNFLYVIRLASKAGVVFFSAGPPVPR